MAVPTGSGTETLHSVLMEDVVNSSKILIQGVQHHTYTLLSLNIKCISGSDIVYIGLTGYDSAGSASAQVINVFQYTPVVGETFVYNDKFSFFGYEPSSNTQAARAAQAGSAAQHLYILTGGSGTAVDVVCTFIDADFS